MKILITGAAGFIGCNLSEFFLEKKHEVFGIDNLDDDYSFKIKKKRILNLKKFKKFKFFKFDLSDKKKLFNLKKIKFDLIIHLAAQAGVRYSFINPDKYYHSNIISFINLVEFSRKYNFHKIIYASSSSIYGESKKFPLKENHKPQPKNIYAVSKQINEEIADMYHKLYNINFVGLRFFTIYGEWGRPDMLLFKIFKSHLNKKKLFINNFGNHSRNFTYIKDVIKIIDIISKNKIKNHQIFNISSNNPVNILNLINKFKKNFSLKTQMIKMHKADVLKTHGDNKKIKKFTKFKKFSNFNEKFFEVFRWYKQNKFNKL